MARLEKASDEVIRRILVTLCEDDEEIEKKALTCLDAYATEKYRSHLDGSERQQDGTAGTKRKADESLPEVYLCRQCGEGFLEEYNNDRACFHHPGSRALIPVLDIEHLTDI
jgi:rubrerythrin